MQISSTAGHHIWCRGHFGVGALQCYVGQKVFSRLNLNFRFPEWTKKVQIETFNEALHNFLDFVEVTLRP